MALGGNDGINQLRSAEIYDPGLKPKNSLLFCRSCEVDIEQTARHFSNSFLTGTNQWDPLPDMNEARSGLSAVTYGSSVFAIGGHNRTGWTGGVEQYDFEEEIWRHYTSLATPRTSHRFIITLVTINSICMAQVHRIRGQGVRSGRV